MEGVIKMNIKQDYIPTSNSNRPGTKINPSHITIHETANTSKGADAEVHARYMKGINARNRKVSWHFTVDDKQIIQHLPTNEKGWHAGSKGNSQSVGIELCVNSDGDFEKTKMNAQWLVKKLMGDLNISIERVVTHKYWTGKNCPAKLLNDWDMFIKSIEEDEKVRKEIEELQNKNANLEKRLAELERVYEIQQTSTKVSDYAETPQKWVKENGISDGTKPKAPATREQVWTMLYRVYKLIMEKLK